VAGGARARKSLLEAHARATAPPAEMNVVEKLAAKRMVELGLWQVVQLCFDVCGGRAVFGLGTACAAPSPRVTGSREKAR